MSSLQPEYHPDAPAVIPRYKQSRLWTTARASWLGDGVRQGRRFSHEVLSLFAAPPPTGPRVQELISSLERFPCTSSQPGETNEVAEDPIFLLSTGWRSGSTLLQRILVTDPRLLLWGEPQGEMALLPRLTEMVSHFISRRNLKEWINQPALSSSTLSQSWIANLYPPADDFRSALRAVFDRLLGEPAKRHGFSRWGFKEVRIGAAEAVLLRWLFPEAKFLVISRHPYDCYRSLVDSGWSRVYDRYPEVSVDSALAFARHWNRIAMSWSELPDDFPLISIRYEDMLARKVDFRFIESWLGIKIQEDIALSSPVGGTATRASLSWYERLIVSRVAAPGMRALGYPS